jgi:hypothetical protein
MHALCPYVGIAILTQKLSSYCEIICRYCTKSFMFIEMLCVEYKNIIICHKLIIYIFKEKFKHFINALLAFIV